MRIYSVEFYSLDHHKMSVFVFSITKQNNFSRQNLSHAMKEMSNMFSNEWKESMLLKENDTKPPALLGICLLLMS